VGKLFDFSLGEISNLHCRMADLYSTRSDMCLALAQAHSLAVDADKTGIRGETPAWIESMKAHTTKLTKRPHFLKSKTGRGGFTYHSKGVLGKLYDAIEKHLEKIDTKVDGIAIDEELLVEGYEEFLADAEKATEDFIKKTYDAYNMCQNNKASKARVKKKILESMDDFFFHNAESNVPLSESNLYKKASAWYYVAYTKAIASFRQRLSLDISFELPWCTVAGRFLCTIKAKKQEKDKSGLPVVIAASVLSMLT